MWFESCRSEENGMLFKGQTNKLYSVLLEKFKRQKQHSLPDGPVHLKTLLCTTAKKIVSKRFRSKKKGVRFMWIEHMTFRFVVPEVLLQSDALPTELNPQRI